MNLIKRVLIAKKATRLEYETARAAALTPAAANKVLTSPAVLRAHEAHHASLGLVAERLKQRRPEIACEVVNSRLLSSLNPKDFDLVITVGGDGCVLEAAQFIGTSRVPLLPINSDPVTSTGKLCTMSIRQRRHAHSARTSTTMTKEGAVILDSRRTSESTPDEADDARLVHAFDRLEELVNTSYIERPRLSMRIMNDDCTETIRRSNMLALNEYFFAELDACRVTNHETCVEESGESFHRQRSCGVLVATDSGSTAWIHSACSLSPVDVARVLEKDRLRQRREQDCLPLDKEHVMRITRELNDEVVFENRPQRATTSSPSALKMAYYVRDPLCDYRDPRFDFDHTPHRGFVTRVALKSLGFNVCVSVDGLVGAREFLRYGEVAVMECLGGDGVETNLKVVVPSA